MKARTIKKLRKHISTRQNYYRDRYENIIRLLSDWERFAKFKCNISFVSSEECEYNTNLYYANVTRLRWKAEWYKKRMATKVKLIDAPYE